MIQDQEALLHKLQRSLSAREYPKTLCPSEIPRSLSAEELSSLGFASWRDLMPPIRNMIKDLRMKGEVEILQRGEVIDRNIPVDDVKGPIRVRRTHP